MISYEPLWVTMSKKGMTTYTLRKNGEVSSSTVRRLKENESVSTNTLDVICKILDCNLQDIVLYEKDWQKEISFSKKLDRISLFIQIQI